MQIEDLTFFHRHEEILQTRNHLPHWQQPAATYFVTFRLADSIPHELQTEWKEKRNRWLAQHPEPWTTETEQEYHRRFSAQFEQWLDQGHGQCVLRDPVNAKIVHDALLHFDQVRYEILSSVIMPNHVHLLVNLSADWQLEEVLHSWKLFSARKINQRLGRKGQLWQHDYFDRLVRNSAHFCNCARYIKRNPIKAKLPAGNYLHCESDLAKSIDETRSDTFQVPFPEALGKVPLLS